MDYEHRRSSEQILRAYGEPFLQYLLGLDGQSVNVQVLAEQKSTILTELTKVATTPSTEGTFEIDVSHNALFHFMPCGVSTVGRATELRRESNGRTLEAPSTDDPFLAQLFRLTAVYWPGITLLKGWHDSVHRFGVSNGVNTLGSSIGEATARSLLDDHQLRKLFPSSSSAGNPFSNSVVSCDWSLSADAGGQVTATVSSVIEQMLQVSAVRLEATGTAWTLENYCEVLARTVNQFRELAQGREALFPIVIGLDGIPAVGSAPLRFNMHTVRRSSALDSHLLGRFGMGSHTLTLEMPTQLLAQEFVPNNQRTASCGYRNLNEMVDTEVNAIRLAILLADESERRIATTRLYTRFFDPRSPGATELWSTSTLEGIHHDQAPALDAGTADSIIETYSQIRPRLDEINHSALPVRRLLQAAGNRVRSTDSLVDAFIAIEGLLSPGKGQKCLTDKLATAVAVLVAPSVETQQSIKSQVKALYNLRSELVHGDRNATELLESQSREAINFACRIIKVICLQESCDFRKMKASKRNSRLRERASPCS